MTAKKKLSKDAYGGVPGNKYKPFVTNGKDQKSGNAVIMIMGAILAVIFAASTTYSGMKAGLTVSAGIPGSILGSGLVGVFAHKKGILGKNIMAGMSAGGETIASGMIYVLPAVVLVGGKINFLQGILAGGFGLLFALGVAALVENYLLIEEHGTLMYPESMAISEALVASDEGGDSLKYMGIGFGIGGGLTLLTTQVFGLFNSMISYVGSSFYKWKLDVEVNPMLAGIGFIIGLPVAISIFSGAILSNFAIAPLIGYFTDLAGSHAHAWNDVNLAVNTMGVNDIASSYVKYIGAGMMLAGGLIGAVQLIPTIITSLKSALGASSSTDDEKSNMSTIFMGVGALGAFILGYLVSGNFLIALVGGLLIIVLSLLFIIVSGRLSGTIGSSNNPISGMTIASLVIMTLVFVIFGWTSNSHSQILLMLGTFLVTAISVGGSYIQAQKVTYILGGSRTEMMKYFAIAGIVGTFVVVGTISVLSPQFSSTDATPVFGLPQANLIATLTSGIMSGSLPWIMIIVGVVMAIVFYFLDLSVMTVALGFYLPISTTSIIFIGALIRQLIEVTSKKDDVKDNRVQSGISLSSGLVAGGSIIGLIGIILHVTGVLSDRALTGFAGSNYMAMILLVVMIILILIPLYRIKKGANSSNAKKATKD